MDTTPPDGDAGPVELVPSPTLHHRVKARLDETWTRVNASGVGHVQRRFVQADLANQALILAALAFTLLVPVLVTLAAVLPLNGTNSLPTVVAGRLGLSAGAARDLQQLFPQSSTVRGASTAVGVAFTVVSAYSWPTALQRGYEIAWSVDSRGWRGLWRPFVWLTVFLAVGAALIELPTSHLLAEPWRTLLLLLLGAPVVFLWSWWTQYFLLRGAVRWGLLLAGALAMTAGLVGLRAAAGIFLSSGVTYNYGHYGPLGIVFLLMTWLVAASAVMLGGPVFGAALHERRALLSEAAGDASSQR
jgi:membrane protein